MKYSAFLALLATCLLASPSSAQKDETSPVQTIKEMIAAMLGPSPAPASVLERAYLSRDLRRRLEHRTDDQARDFDADPITGAQDWSDWKLDRTVSNGNEIDVFFLAGKARIRRDYIMIKDGDDWRIDDVAYHDDGKVTKLRDTFGAKPEPVSSERAPQRAPLKPSPAAEGLAQRFPWMVKAQGELTGQQCAAASRHDANFWWSRGKCHMKFIRYAAGVALRDTHAVEDQSSVRKKGELFSPTQYRPNEDSYCEHGGYCYPARDIKLLGSIRTPPDAQFLTGDKDMDAYQGVATSCELLQEDAANILAANAQELLRDCR